MEFQKNYSASPAQLKSNQPPIKSGASFLLVVLAAIASVSFAQPAATLPEEPISAGDANAVSAVVFPYVAEITGDDVRIRSGPGTNFYSCGKLYKADRVEVVSTQFGWSRIVPPAGCFSWISMQYIGVNLDNPTIGIVTGDDVCVYAGSDTVKPMHSTSEQVKLKRGDKVTLLGEGEDDYYKIAPPSGAYLWVSTQYTKPARPIVAEMPPPTVTAADANVVVATVISIEAEKLKEFYVLQEKLKAERAKPMDQQNYAEIKKALKDIAGNKEAGKAVRYAEFVVRQVEGCELAVQVAKEVKLQKAQLQRVMEGIDKARATRLAKTENLGRFMVIGEFQTFETYGTGHFRIVDESGKMMCYALPSGQASETDLSKFIGRQVGLVGTAEPHPATAGALVRFTEVVELEGKS
jgi:uncharacterized protein YgiM (DUF1202 family)